MVPRLAYRVSGRGFDSHRAQLSQLVFAFFLPCFFLTMKMMMLSIRYRAQLLGYGTQRQAEKFIFFGGCKKVRLPVRLFVHNLKQHNNNNEQLL